jgi:hypothetical protein
MNSADPPDEELRLSPTDPEVDAHRRQIRETHLPIRPVHEVSEKRRVQFGLIHLIAGTTLVCFFSAALQWWDASLLAVVLGFAAMFLLVAMGIVQVTHPTLRFAWWCLLGLYLAFVVVAMLTG